MLLQPTGALSAVNSSPTFSFNLVQGIGGNFAGEPQGIAYDPENDMFYAMSNNSGNREVKKINRAGTTLVTNSNQGGSTLSIQDGAFYNGKVYVPRTNPGVEGVLQRFDTDLNHEADLAFPTGVLYTVAIDFAHGYWWASCNSLGTLYQLSEDLTTIVDTHDIDTTAGNTYTGSPHYSGLSWYGNYMFGIDHTQGGDVDIWLWDGSSLTIYAQLSQGAFDLYNGIAIDDVNNKMYASSRGLSDDLQEYDIIIE